MSIDITGSSYLIDMSDVAATLRSSIAELEQRMESLRERGKLTNETLLAYYGEKRFEQIAESNALEGSTLSVGETELAVLKGMTITGHDPAYSLDAQALARALDELTDMARDKTPTDIAQVKHLHELILGERPSAGAFRTGEVRIRGSKHVPPRTWSAVMDQMGQWQSWSRSHVASQTLLRAAVLHAWLEHIHPFVDGNGRTGRAITNLELVRAGYPPVIIRRKDRDRYLDALARADDGDLGPSIDLLAGRMDDGLRDLERSASKHEGYDALRQTMLRAQANRLAVWNAGVHLLFETIRSELTSYLDAMAAKLEMREFDQLRVEDFIDLCERHPVHQSWAFTIRCRTAGGPPVEFLAWVGFPSDLLSERLTNESGRPALFWSVPNPDRYPPWVRAGEESPGGEQMTILNDRWLVVREGTLRELSPSQLAAQIVEDIGNKLVPDPRS